MRSRCLNVGGGNVIVVGEPFGGIYRVPAESNTGVSRLAIALSAVRRKAAEGRFEIRQLIDLFLAERPVCLHLSLYVHCMFEQGASLGTTLG